MRSCRVGFRNGRWGRKKGIKSLLSSYHHGYLVRSLEPPDTFPCHSWTLFWVSLPSPTSGSTSLQEGEGELAGGNSSESPFCLLHQSLTGLGFSSDGKEEQESQHQ